MEKLKREKVVKMAVNGGKGVVCIERFLVVKYISMCVKIANKGVYGWMYVKIYGR